MAGDLMIDILANLTGLGRNLGTDILSQCEFVH
jgi:hypothetical protein